MPCRLRHMEVVASVYSARVVSRIHVRTVCSVGKIIFQSLSFGEGYTYPLGKNTHISYFLPRDPRGLHMFYMYCTVGSSKAQKLQKSLYSYFIALFYTNCPSWTRVMQHSVTIVAHCSNADPWPRHLVTISGRMSWNHCVLCNVRVQSCEHHFPSA